MEIIENAEISELPEIPLEPAAGYIRTARLSLLEESEQSAVNEIRLKHEHEDKQANDTNPKRDAEHGSDLAHGDGNGPSPTDEQHLGDDPNAPSDKGYFVLTVMGFFGLVHMMPFTFLFQANEYWKYKFRNTTSGADADDMTFLQTNFFALATVAMTAPGILLIAIAALVGHKVKPQTRIYSVLFIHTSVLVSHAIFGGIDTDNWEVEFFVVAMVLVVIMSAAMSLGGSGSMALISKLPRRYLKAQLMGEGVSSVFSVGLRLISIFVAPSTIDSALIFFITGAVLMGGMSILFYFATQTKYFKYYTRDYKEERKQKMRNVGDFKKVLKIVWPVLLISVVPLVVPFGSVSGLVRSEYGEDSVWGGKYFVTVCTYLLPALTGVLGRGIFNYMDYDCSIPVLYIIVISRETIFGVLTLLSNTPSRNHLPVLLKHDWQYALMMVGSSLTSGFNANLLSLKTMRIAPKDRIELSMMCSMFFTAVAAAATSPLGLVVVNLL